MSSSQTISLALTKVEHAGTDSKVEHAGTDQKVEHAGTDSKIEHGGTDGRPKAGWVSALVLGLILVLPGALFAGELEGFFPFNDGVWKVRGALNGPLTMQYIGNDTVNVSFATYDEKGMPVMLVGSGSWNDGLIELPLYQVKAISGFNDFTPTSNLVPWGHAALVVAGCGSMEGELWQLQKSLDGGTNKGQDGGTNGKSQDGGTNGNSQDGGTNGDSQDGGTNGSLTTLGIITMSSASAGMCGITALN